MPPCASQQKLAVDGKDGSSTTEAGAAEPIQRTSKARQQTAALRDFDPAHVRFGSILLKKAS
jgi:hypothetical protein